MNNEQEKSQNTIHALPPCDIIEQTGAASMKDMGKVMGIATKQLAGRAEGRAISAKVKELLN